jgi:hypothetical protein
MNYNTEIVLNPILLESDFDLNPIDLNVALDLGTVDFSIDVFTGSNVTIIDQVNSDWNATTGKAEILNKPLVPVISYQASAPTNPQLNDIWISSVTLIQYQWIGAWVNFNIQSLINL